MDNEQAHAHEVLSRIHTYPIPPDGFDPHSATEADLLRYGYPRRPDAHRQPALRRLWDQAIARAPRFVKPEFRIDDRLRRRTPRRHDPRDPAEAGNTWAGATVDQTNLHFSPPEPINTVYGAFMVPGVILPPGITDSLNIAFWVGIGGDTGSNNLLQAGVTAIVSPGSVQYVPWYLWWVKNYGPAQHAVPISNFPVTAGDHVSVLVCTPRPDHGIISMMNITTNQVTTFGVDAWPSHPADGSSAEWIIEDANGGLVIADFFSVIFGNIQGGTANHTFDLRSGVTTDITNANGVNLTSSAIISPIAVSILWERAE